MSIKDLTKEAELKSQIEIAQRGINSAEEAGIVISQNKINALNDLIAKILEAKSLSEEELDNLNEGVAARQKALDLSIKQNGEADTATIQAKKLLAEEVKSRDDIAELRKQSLDDAKEQRDVEEDINKILKKRTKDKDSLKSKTKQILSAMTGIDDMANNTAMGQFFAVAKAQGFATALKQVGSAMKEVFTMGNVLGSAGIGEECHGNRDSQGRV